MPRLRGPTRYCSLWPSFRPQVRRGLLLSVLTLEDILNLLQGMRASPRVSGVQTALVCTWLWQGERTDEDISRFCKALHHDLWLSAPERGVNILKFYGL